MEYVQLKKVHLFFYSKDSSNKYNYLLYKSAKEDLYHHMFNDITGYDGGSIYSISRKINKNFATVLTDEFISKLQKKEQFEVKNENKNLKQYELWENETFTFWLDKLSKNPIQYDSINEEVIYYIEIPNLSIESLNSMLDKNNFEYRFEYINDNNYSSFKLSDETNKLLYQYEIENMYTNKTSLKLKAKINVSNDTEPVFRKLYPVNSDKFILASYTLKFKDDDEYVIQGINELRFVNSNNFTIKRKYDIKISPFNHSVVNYKDNFLIISYFNTKDKDKNIKEENLYNFEDYNINKIFNIVHYKTTCKIINFIFYSCFFNLFCCNCFNSFNTC